MSMASVRVVRSVSVTCHSADLATRHTVVVPASSRWRSTGSASAAVWALRVEPKATSVAVWRCRSPAAARRKNSSSLGLAPGQPPSM